MTCLPERIDCFIIGMQALYWEAMQHESISQAADNTICSVLWGTRSVLFILSEMLVSRAHLLQPELY